MRRAAGAKRAGATKLAACRHYELVQDSTLRSSCKTATPPSGWARAKLYKNWQGQGRQKGWEAMGAGARRRREHGAGLSDFVIRGPDEVVVWEIPGAEFTKSESSAGVLIRHPRFCRVHDDKDLATATSLSELHRAAPGVYQPGPKAHLVSTKLRGS